MHGKPLLPEVYCYQSLKTFSSFGPQQASSAENGAGSLVLILILDHLEESQTQLEHTSSSFHCKAVRDDDK